MQTTKKKVIVIDDAQYIMSNEFFRRVKESSWDKYYDIASNFFKVLTAVDSLPDDTFVYFLSHKQKDDNGIEKIKTIGKMLDEKLTIEGLFTVVLKTCVYDGVYSFQTQNSGYDTCKSPIGMFNNFLIDNDLKMVDSIIREYWGYSKDKVKEVAVAENGPTARTPNPILVQGAKAHVLKEAPVIQSASPSNVDNSNDEAVEEVTEETVEEAAPVNAQPAPTPAPAPAKEEPAPAPFSASINGAVVEENNFDSVKQEEPVEESNEAKMARIMAKLKRN